MSKNLNPEQLVKDGFVQLKSLRQLQKQGILPKDKCTSGYIRFNNTKSRIHIVPSMYNFLGKVVQVDSAPHHNEFYINAEGWSWPIECIQR